MIFDKEDYKAYDADLWNAIAKEEERQQNNIELIASENVVSKAVMAAQGSILTNKYAEGYPGRRYYGGTDVVDVVESLAIERAKEIFGAKFANVQPHSGSQANCAAYMALIEPGDTVMGMDLAAGGHLTHGASVSFSGQTYNFVSYSVDPETELLDFDAILKQAQEVKPKLIVAGASAYSHIIDFSKFREIADAVGAKLMVDMAHIAGLVAAGLHPSPVPYAHITTTTTHKTLRGPRGGLILTNDEDLAKKILGDDCKILEKDEVSYHCDCSKEKYAGMLETLKGSQLKEMIDEDHGAELVCNFCGNKYNFTEAELQAILDKKLGK